MLPDVVRRTPPLPHTVKGRCALRASIARPGSSRTGDGARHTTDAVMITLSKLDPEGLAPNTNELASPARCGPCSAVNWLCRREHAVRDHPPV